MATGRVTGVQGQIVGILVCGDEVTFVLAQFEVPWEIAGSGNRLDVVDGAICLDGKDGNRVFAPVGGVNELPVLRDVNGSGPVVGRPISRDGLDGLDMRKRASGRVVLQDFQLTGQFPEQVSKFPVRRKDQVPGTEAGFGLVARFRGQLPFRTQVVNHDQIHP